MSMSLDKLRFKINHMFGDLTVLTQMVLTIGAHWRPLELKIKKGEYTELTRIVISIGAHWSTLELEIEKRDKAELIQMVMPLESIVAPVKPSTP
jgi:hypothetical protein